MPANTEIEGAVSLAPPDIDLSPDRIEFGRVFVPLSLTASYHAGQWGPMRVDRLSNFNLHPASTVFHYAQSIFEGLKAYRWADGSVNLFRPSENAARFARSATRMAIPPINEADFVEGIRALVDLEREWIPVEPGSLYIRPVIIATEACLGVRAAHDFLYFVITLPTGAYFPQLAKSAGTGTVRVYVTTTVG